MSMTSVASVIPIPRTHNPFGREGVSLDTSGCPHYDDLPATLIVLLRERAETSPDVEAVAELGGVRLTYRQLWDGARRVAGGLASAGLAPGDRVAIRYPAGVDWVLGFLGTMVAGGVAVVPTRSTPREIEFVLDDAGVRFDLAPGTPLPDGQPYVDGKASADTPAAMFYTSGTTGQPKGVPTSHEAFLTNAESLVRVLGVDRRIGPDFRTLISIPLFHVTGCNSQLIAALYVGGSAIIMPALDQAALIDALAAESISFMVTVPAVYALLLRHPALSGADVSSVRWVGYGGAAIAPSLVARIQEAFPRARVFNGYGMTETAALLTALPHEDAVAHADSVGFAVPTVELAVAPSDGDPNVGELLARGAAIMTGYWDRPQATAEALAGGWMHTGDVVRVDAQGRIRIIDRTKDIIIRGGENISSLEVEAALVSAPTVLEAAVLAVPDSVMGEKVGAVIFGGEDRVDVAAVLEHCRERLADFKVPQYVQVVTSPLPRNAGGKLLKAELRRTAAWGAPHR